MSGWDDYMAREVQRLEAERDAALRERDRAVETRENANAVSLRVEAERDRYKAALEEIAATDPVDAALDPDRSRRIAERALNQNRQSEEG